MGDALKKAEDKIGMNAPPGYEAELPKETDDPSKGFAAQTLFPEMKKHPIQEKIGDLVDKTTIPGPDEIKEFVKEHVPHK